MYLPFSTVLSFCFEAFYVSVPNCFVCLSLFWDILYVFSCTGPMPAQSSPPSPCDVPGSAGRLGAKMDQELFESSLKETIAREFKCHPTRPPGTALSAHRDAAALFSSGGRFGGRHV